MIDFTFKMSGELQEKAEKICRAEYNIPLDEAITYFVNRLVNYGGFPFLNDYDTEGARMRIKTTDPKTRSLLKDEFAAKKMPCTTDKGDTLIFTWGNSYELISVIMQHRKKEWFRAVLESLTECILFEGYKREDILTQIREKQ